MVGITSPPCRPWIAADHAWSGPKKGLSQSMAIAAKPSRPRPCCISLASILPAVAFSLSHPESHAARLADIPSL